MTAERFIQELADRQMLSDAVLKRLREKTSSGGSPPPKALAQFLIDKGHLTESQAQQALDAIAPEPEPEPVVETAAEPEVDKLASIAESGGEEEEEDSDSGDGKSKAKGSKKRQYKRLQTKKNEFDSPLLLLGGGGLILLLLLGGGILFILARESGDEVLKVAREAFEAGSYQQAIAQYERYVEDYPSHAAFSNGKVELGMTRIRQAVETGGNPIRALSVAQIELDVMEEEEAFSTVKSDLSALLPTIATGLAAKADEADELAKMNELAEKTEAALALCLNTNYVPDSLQDKRQLSDIREVLERISGRQKALEELGASLKAMQVSLDENDPAAAYLTRATFVKAYPTYSEDASLVEAVGNVVQAEKEFVRFVEQPQQAETSQPESAVESTTAFADRRRKGQSPAKGVSVVSFGGAAYALSNSDGRLLWRQYLGESLQATQPLNLGREILVIDARRKELTKLAAADGKLVWRLAIDDELLQPVLSNGVLYVAGTSGKLYVIDEDSGAMAGYMQFAQKLRSPPTIDKTGSRLYQAGEHSSIFTLDLSERTCLGVHYLGHDPGSITAAPSIVLSNLLVAENDGVASSQLHMLGTNDEGIVGDAEAQHRLTGLVQSAPMVFGRRFAVITDLGQVSVYEVAQGQSDTPTTLLALREPTRKQRGSYYLTVADGAVWVAERGLAKYSISPTGKRLPIEPLADPFTRDRFVRPLQLVGNVLINARQRGDKGVTISATDTKSGKAYWETDLAAPPASEPISFDGSTQLMQPTLTGKLFQLQLSGQANEVCETSVAMDTNTALEDDFQAITGSAVLDGNSVVLATAGDQVHSVLAAASTKPTPLQLPGKLSAPPTLFAGGWLAPIDLGQVLLLDASGEPQAVPFQPTIELGSATNWLPVTVGEVDGKPAALVASRQGAVHRLVVDNRGIAPRLVAAASLKIPETTLGASPVMAGEFIAVATQKPELIVYSLDLQEIARVPLAAPAIWGPHSVDQSTATILVGTADGQLKSIDLTAPEQPLWQTTLATNQLIGSPMLSDGALLLASRQGDLLSLDPASGELTARYDLGQPLLTAMNIAGGTNANTASRWLASGSDGSLLVIRSR